MAWQLFVPMILGAGLGYGRGLMQDQQTVAKIKSLQLQAGWTEDYGDMLLETANRGAMRKKRVALRQSLSIMNSADVNSMKIKAQAERNASSQLVKAAGRGADVGSGTPLENAALQMEVGDAEARSNMRNARNSIKSLWDDVKWETDEMKKSASFQKKMQYRKASLMKSSAEGLEGARGANMFMNVLGGFTQGTSMGISLDQAYGTKSTDTSGGYNPTPIDDYSSIGRKGATRY